MVWVRGSKYRTGRGVGRPRKKIENEGETAELDVSPPETVAATTAADSPPLETVAATTEGAALDVHSPNSPPPETVAATTEGEPEIKGVALDVPSEIVEATAEVLPPTEGATEGVTAGDVPPPRTDAEATASPTLEEINIESDLAMVLFEGEPSNSATQELAHEEVQEKELPLEEEQEKEAGLEKEDEEDETPPLQPEKFYFSPDQYTRVCKIGSRCTVVKTVSMIKKLKNELTWFTRHPQFKHIFHMEEEPNRKPMGLWMLLLHQACTDSEKEFWFVVNGVPIRYSIREHALLSGLDCHHYPRVYDDLRDKKKGDFKFVQRIFGRKDNIRIEDVEEKMQSLTSGLDKKKMAVLFFLCTVLKAKSKVKGNIEPFLLKLVDDLTLCKTFPWGRYTFDDYMEEMKRAMKKFKKGIVKDKESLTFSGFILPLEIFVFECIPALKRTFRVEVATEKDCPRMCKHKFLETSMKGYPLEDINEAIGNTKDIISILEPDSDEKALMEHIIGDDCDDRIGFIDPIVEMWRDHLIRNGKKIWWKDLYDIDLAARVVDEDAKKALKDESNDEIKDESKDESVASLLGLKEAVKRMEKVIQEVKDKVDGFDERLKSVESFMKEHRIKGPESVRSPAPSPAPSPALSHIDDEEGEDADEKEEDAEEVVEPLKKRTKKAPSCYTPSEHGQKRKRESEGQKKDKGDGQKKGKGDVQKNGKGVGKKNK